MASGEEKIRLMQEIKMIIPHKDADIAPIEWHEKQCAYMESDAHRLILAHQRKRLGSGMSGVVGVVVLIGDDQTS